MVSGAERVRGVRYPLVMPSQIAVVIKPVASSSSGSRSPGSSRTVKPLETGADPTRRAVGGYGGRAREIATQSWDRLRDRG
jgi:hypothetical protein